MSSENWKQKTYKTWEEAFRGLAPVVRQQSARTADYTRVLFLEACVYPAYAKDPSIPLYMNVKYEETAYKCGLYHQLGKALLPPEYQVWRESFTEEEKIMFRKYTTDGKELVSRLQGEDDEEVSIPSKMIRKSCEQHMERWNGSGFPKARTGADISLIGQIVGLAKELDWLVSSRRSENPFEEAIETLVAQKDRMFSSDLISVLKNCRGELRAVYKKYIQYTKALPKTVPLVDKRKERPFGLKYRALPEQNGMSYYESVAWFGAVLDKPEDAETMEEVEPLLNRVGMMYDVNFYLLYEAADAALRMKNCSLPCDGILVPMFQSFFRGDNQWNRFDQLFTDQPIEKKKLMMLVPGELLHFAEPALVEQLTGFLERGMTLVLDDLNPEKISLMQILEIGFTHVRFPEEMTFREKDAEVLEKLQSNGITIVDRVKEGFLFTEDELIRGMLSEE